MHAKCFALKDTFLSANEILKQKVYNASWIQKLDNHID